MLQGSRHVRPSLIWSLAHVHRGLAQRERSILSPGAGKPPGYRGPKNYLVRDDCVAKLVIRLGPFSKMEWTHLAAAPKGKRPLFFRWPIVSGRDPR